MPPPETLIIDWKAPGKEFLPRLAELAPQRVCLQGEAFELLVDHLAEEPAQHSLSVLAAHLVRHGLDLWNLAGNSDTWEVFIAEQGDREFIARNGLPTWGDNGEPTGPSGLPERVEGLEDPGVLSMLDAPAAPARKKRSPKPKLIWLDEGYELGVMLHPLDFGYTDGIVDHWERNAKGHPEQLVLFDFNHWYPEELTPLEALPQEMRAPLAMKFAFRDGSRLCFKRVVRKAKFEEFFVFGYLEGGAWEGMGDPQVQLSEPHSRTHRLGDRLLHTTSHGLYRVTATTTQEVFRSEDELVTCALADGKVLVHWKNSRRIAVYDDATGQASDLNIELPGAPYNNQFTHLGQDEVLMFILDERSHPQQSHHIESFLSACILDIRHQRMRVAELPGIESVQRCDARMLSTQASNHITLRSFQGCLSVTKGHGDWWIWNQITDAYGVSMRVWFWNAVTQEVIKADSRQMPRLEPTIEYSKGLGRYVFFLHDECWLMTDFDHVREHLGTSRLQWQPLG